MPGSDTSRERHLSEMDWMQAVIVYELGHKNGRQLAALFGVSPQAITKGLRKRGAIKGCRAVETTRDLDRQLAAKQARRWEFAQAASDRLGALMQAMMEGLVAADKAGSLCEADEIMEKVRRAI